MCRSIVFLAMCLFPIVLAFPSFHIAVPHVSLSDQTVQILYACSEQCTGSRKAAEVLMTDDREKGNDGIYFASPQWMRPYCENSTCIDKCVLPKTTTPPLLVTNSPTTKAICTSDDYAKSYECLNQHGKDMITQCVYSNAASISDNCKLFVDTMKCVVDRLPEKCGESSGRAFKPIGDEVIQLEGCQKPE